MVFFFCGLLVLFVSSSYAKYFHFGQSVRTKIVCPEDRKQHNPVSYSKPSHSLKWSHKNLFPVEVCIHTQTPNAVTPCERTNESFISLRLRVGQAVKNLRHPLTVSDIDVLIDIGHYCHPFEARRIAEQLKGLDITNAELTGQGVLYGDPKINTFEGDLISVSIRGNTAYFTHPGEVTWSSSSVDLKAHSVVCGFPRCKVVDNETNFIVETSRFRIKGEEAPEYLPGNGQLTSEMFSVTSFICNLFGGCTTTFKVIEEVLTTTGSPKSIEVIKATTSPTTTSNLAAKSSLAATSSLATKSNLAAKSNPSITRNPITRSGVGVGAIIGIVIGVLALIIAVAVGVYIWYFQKDASAPLAPIEAPESEAHDGNHNEILEEQKRNQD